MEEAKRLSGRGGADNVLFDLVTGILFRPKLVKL
jgi:hypothetical protein